MLNNHVDKLDHYKERAKELGISLEAIAELQSIKINTYERSY